MGKKNKSSPTVEAPRQEIERLQEIYSFLRKEEVAGFLESYPYLVPLLFEACPQVRKHFGCDAPVFLEVVTDPEATDDRELYALIGTRLPPEAALEKLERFDNEWWSAVLDRAQCKLCIDVGFV
jgi:hypothetical protein